jgi:hypothetical protein
MIRHIVRFPALALVASTLLSSCATEPVPTTLVPNQTSLELDAIGASATLSVTVNDENGEPITGQSVTWASSNDGVATVSSAGLVTAVAVGTADITATANGASVTVPVTVTQAPAILAMVSGNDQTGTAGGMLANPLVAQVNDRLQNAIPGVSVDFAVTEGGGSVGNASATSGADGRVSSTWTLGTVAGNNEATASMAGGAAPVTFSATGTAGPAAQVSVAGGDNQAVLVGTAVNVAPAVLVVDVNDNPVEGVDVTFAVATGGGNITPAGGLAVTDASGIASVAAWVLGPAAGENTLTATVAGTGITGNPVTFTAAAVASLFDIEVRFVGATPPTAQQQLAFNNAAARWEELVIGDLPDQLLNVNLPAGSCRSDDVVMISESVDDLIILAEFKTIDGLGNIAGQASWCIVRSLGNGLPLLGVMEFDVDDWGTFSAAEQEAVVLHEMGHVLGIGTLWDQFGFLQLPSDPLFGGTPGNDTHFTGPKTITAFDAIGNKPYTGGNKVPVENDNATYLSGSLDAHWRESVFDTELMTPELDGANPLSVVTVASLEDLGFVVDQGGADPFGLVFPFRVGPAGRKIVLENDVMRRPGYAVDASGRLTRIR